MDKTFLCDIVIQKVYSVMTLYSPEGASAKRESRPSSALIIKYEGETVYTTKKGKFTSDISHIAFLPKGSAYEWKCEKGGHYTIVEFKCNIEMDDIFLFDVRDGEKVLKMFKELEYRRNLSGPFVELESIQGVYSILLSLIKSAREEYAPSHKQKIIAPAVEYISKNYNKSITNDALAALCGVSTVYFRKLFTSILGVSPIAYIHKLRIQKAKEMLASDYGTLSDIAYSLGYADIYDFSRDFKKHTGLAPSKYR